MTKTNQSTDETQALYNAAALFGRATATKTSAIKLDRLRHAARAALDAVPARQAMEIYSAAFTAGQRAVLNERARGR